MLIISETRTSSVNPPIESKSSRLAASFDPWRAIPVYSDDLFGGFICCQRHQILSNCLYWILDSILRINKNSHLRMMQKEKRVVRRGKFNEVASDSIRNLIMRTVLESEEERLIIRLPKDLLDSFGSHLGARESSQCISSMKAP